MTLIQVDMNCNIIFIKLRKNNLVKKKIFFYYKSFKNSFENKSLLFEKLNVLYKVNDYEN
jgi:hypothetical protein